jgi:hypothetical protein
MSNVKVNPNVWHAIVAQALDATTGTATSGWHDVGGWTDKSIWFETTGANPDFDVDIHISPLDYYTLTNKTVTTDDYIAVNIVTAHGDQILTIKTADDEDKLQRPFMSMRVVVGNDSATAVTTCNVKVMGWS